MINDTTQHEDITLNEAIELSHRYAVEAGFWPMKVCSECEGNGFSRYALPNNDEGVIKCNCFNGKVADMASRNFGEMMALVHSELSEALEEQRDGHLLDEVYTSLDTRGNAKPEGVPIELMDAAIRLFDILGALGINGSQLFYTKYNYNKTRQPKHGKQF